MSHPAERALSEKKRCEGAEQIVHVRPSKYHILYVRGVPSVTYVRTENRDILHIQNI